MNFLKRLKLKTNLPLAQVALERGASSIEFALILPLLSLIIFAIFQFGLLYNNYLAISHAAREGVRQAAVGNFNEQAVKTDAYPVTAADVVLEYPEGVGHGLPVAVTVKANYRLDLPFFGVKNIVLSSKAIMRQEI